MNYPIQAAAENYLCMTSKESFIIVHKSLVCSDSLFFFFFTQKLLVCVAGSHFGELGTQTVKQAKSIVYQAADGA